ncbi:sla2 Src-like adaptor 2 [Nowakowskiella sp. JEL0078]|nr:sla2 Src-like adaptor 2 [Nowakowskiella sp. JEL0078]
MAQIQKSAQENEAALRMELNKLQGSHVAQLNKMMDNILGACIAKIDEAVYELESTATEGNSTATPEYVLSLLEKVNNTCHDFTVSFVKLVNGGDQADAITQSNSLANGISQLLHNSKGLLRTTTDDDSIDRLINAVKSGALGGRQFFEFLQTQSLSRIEPIYRPEYVNKLGQDTQANLNLMGPVLESLVVKQVTPLMATETEDIGDIVEREMMNAAKAVDDAARRLQELLSRPMNLHNSIIEAAAAITKTIAELIRCATQSQQEIVAQSRGAATKGAFYKKNNKWTEGLVSAAKAVAVATTFLVECADGFVAGTHSIEQLVVAAQEVNVATTQLVAASRVKAIPFSKTQDRLESAAVAVRDATKNLVRAAKDHSKRNAEKSADDEIRRMNRHELKVKEMEQQVRILELEKELVNARYKLGEIRKAGYREDDE